MKKHELLKHFDKDLIDKLFGFCYARTNDSYEAEDLCSDIIFALIKSSHTAGEISHLYQFVWRVARNVYADFSNSRRKYADTFWDGNADEILQHVTAEEQADNSDELLGVIYRRIAFLAKAYREVMIMYYIDGLSTAEIAKNQNTSEGAIRQRLFSARQKVKSEVEKMTETYNMGATEIAKELNGPTVYVEEELEILANGENGKYGLLRRMDNGKYAINFILLDKEVIEEAHSLYTEQLPRIRAIISDFIEQHKEEYLSFPYLNKRVNWNLILWQQIFSMSRAFSENVERILAEQHFTEFEDAKRPFSVFGYVDNGKHYGGGWDGIAAQNICGFSKVHMDNIYFTRIKHHFHCGHNMSNDPQIQLTIRAIDGLSVLSLSEAEKEHAAKAIECGYLYRENDGTSWISVNTLES